MERRLIPINLMSNTKIIALIGLMILLILLYLSNTGKLSQIGKVLQSNGNVMGSPVTFTSPTSQNGYTVTPKNVTKIVGPIPPIKI